MQDTFGKTPVILLPLMIVMVATAVVMAEDPLTEPVNNPFPNRWLAPSLDGGIEWLNTSGEITRKDLRGKVVLLDFWTYCCINCMHVLPDLKYLEKKYSNQLVVIGVHSAKFDNEKDSENIRRAILRYEIEHPVINDAKMIVWRKHHVQAWPTIVLVDPEGYYCGFVSGEGNRRLLDGAIAKLIEYHRSKGTLDETPVRFDLEREKLKPMPLKFPGKVLADEKSRRLFISDSNHNRIVISSLDGNLIDVVGSGAIGKQNGTYDQARFDHPQGMTLVGDTLYVADTENHLIRTIDLKQKRVATLAGTGRQARRRRFGGKLKRTALNSPWALLHVKGALYVAMAGPHQIWRHKLGAKTIRVYAGSGREDILNGPLAKAALAQPSGIATDGKFLFVADSEGSAIRSISLNPRGNVSTLVGASDLPHGRALFAFGDIDGVGNHARLQHPLGVVFHDGVLYVADSYNHKIKKVTLKEQAGEATTFLGDGKRGDRLNPPRFSEPAGLSSANGKLYIADTNNHRICVADLKTAMVSVLNIKGLKPPKPQKLVDAGLVTAKKAMPVKLQSVVSGDSVRFEITLSIPEGYKLNKLAPLVYKLKADGQQDLIAANQFTGRHKASAEGTTAIVTIPLAKNAGKATLELALSYGYCRDGIGGLCKIKTVRWLVPLEVSAKGKQNVVKLGTDQVK